MKIKPTYYAVIPANVRYDKDLTPNAKLLYAEITVLTQSNGICWASDTYFMELYNVKRQSIQRWLKSLEDKGYISRKVIYKKGTSEIEKRYIRVYAGMLQGYTQNCDKGIHNNDTVNTTSANTTSINSNTYGDLDKSSSSSKYDKVPFFNEFWELYPKKSGKGQALKTFKNKVKTKETFELISKDLKRRKGFEQWQKNKGQFIPHPSTYLNSEMWLDEYEVKKKSETPILKIKTY